MPSMSSLCRSMVRSSENGSRSVATPNFCRSSVWPEPDGGVKPFIRETTALEMSSRVEISWPRVKPGTSEATFIFTAGVGGLSGTAGRLVCLAAAILRVDAAGTLAGSSVAASASAGGWLWGRARSGLSLALLAPPPPRPPLGGPAPGADRAVLQRGDPLCGLVGGGGPLSLLGGDLGALRVEGFRLFDLRDGGLVQSDERVKRGLLLGEQVREGLVVVLGELLVHDGVMVLRNGNYLFRGHRAPRPLATFWEERY